MIVVFDSLRILSESADSTATAMIVALASEEFLFRSSLTPDSDSDSDDRRLFSDEDFFQVSLQSDSDDRRLDSDEDSSDF
jgi:hypothetical protein